MLVSAVVLRPTRPTLVSAIVETALALDAPSLGTVYATLTDNPGNARDYLDAFTGQRITEAATATDTPDALSAHPASLLEEISAAIAAQDAALNVVVPLVTRQSMVGTAYVNSSGTPRQANANGTMLNL